MAGGGVQPWPIGPSLSLPPVVASGGDRSVWGSGLWTQAHHLVGAPLCHSGWVVSAGSLLLSETQFPHLKNETTIARVTMAFLGFNQNSKDYVSRKDSNDIIIVIVSDVVVIVVFPSGLTGEERRKWGGVLWVPG